MRQDIKSKFSEPLRVLIVEDNSLDKKILESTLTSFQKYASYTKTVETLEDAIKSLESKQFDVVILDLNLPDSKDQDTIRNLNKAFPDIAIVVNTGAYEEESGLETLGFGAQDFLVKGKYTPYVLNKTLHYAVERKKLEVELVQTQEQMRETQTQLIQAEKMKLVGDLASGVAHEVKNPLSIVLYGTSYLVNNLKSDDKKVKDVLENIQTGATRASDIITDLLDFSTLHELDRQPAALNEVVKKALSLTQHKLNESHVVVVEDLGKDLPLVLIDINRIEQVLVNLILNAAQASSSGSEIKLKTFVCECENVDSCKQRNLTFKCEGKAVALEVDDEGIGVEEDVLDKVFNPFYSTKREFGGIGLGLFVCKNIMETHDGDICLVNNKEGGAKARIIFKIQ
ncbi:MAG: ATP-binding protein [Candidatus Zapsychrus exili]|nr:ATP-binding protein [Candidatus Zapsychrus exili]